MIFNIFYNIFDLFFVNYKYIVNDTSHKVNDNIQYRIDNVTTVLNDLIVKLSLERG